MSLLNHAWAALSLGVAFHLAVRNVEIDYRIWQLLTLYITTLAILTGYYVSIGTFTLSETAARVATVSTSFNLGLISSIGVYRLLFHRLRDFPGPLPAKISRFYATSLAAKNVQYSLEVRKLHEEYGDFVRTGPRELSILRASAVPSLYGPQTLCRKSTWYSQVSEDVTKCSLNSSRDFEDHKRRRRAWDQGFSVKALKAYEPAINSKIDLLIEQMRKKAGTAIDITRWSMFFTFDTMGAVGFGKQFRMLDDGAEHSAIKGLHDQMTALGVLSSIPWFLSMVGKIPGLAGSYALFTAWCGEQVEEKKKAFEPSSYPSDIFSWLLKARHEKALSAPPGDEALIEDGRLIIIAGSDTTASALANSLYYLCRYPQTLKKLQETIQSVFPNGETDWSFDKVKEVPYLDAVINETLRLKPAIPGGVPRVTPASGLQIDEVFIPGDVNVIVPAYAVHRDPRYFEDPDAFVPERWTDKKSGMVLDKAAYAPFSLGVYGCIGKNLALLQLRAVLSRLVLNFNLSFAPGETGDEFDANALDTFTLTLPPLQMVLTPRTST